METEEIGRRNVRIVSHLIFKMVNSPLVSGGYTRRNKRKISPLKGIQPPKSVSSLCITICDPEPFLREKLLARSMTLNCSPGGIGQKFFGIAIGSSKGVREWESCRYVPGEIRERKERGRSEREERKEREEIEEREKRERRREKRDERKEWGEKRDGGRRERERSGPSSRKLARNWSRKCNAKFHIVRIPALARARYLLLMLVCKVARLVPIISNQSHWSLSYPRTWDLSNSKRAGRVGKVNEKYHVIRA